MPPAQKLAIAMYPVLPVSLGNEKQGAGARFISLALSAQLCFVFIVISNKIEVFLNSFSEAQNDEEDQTLLLAQRTWESIFCLDSLFCCGGDKDCEI